MSSSVRSGFSSRTSSSVRHTMTRTSTARHGVAATRAGAASPADSLISSMAGGAKRKERDYELDTGSRMSTVGGEETNINVVVRCRGRSAREVKENSAVVVRADGVKGNQVDLSLGLNALTNKTYAFDRVFSSAADQEMVFDDTVRPILDEMLSGYNCTIFAYGQTGTGKTYTMSGDMTETLGMLSDEAGIIPRVLQQLFRTLELDNREHCVKVSFIELYNEELRDLLSVEETAKLKIYDDASRKGHAGTMVQGMEEKHIKDSSEGIKVLQDGSLKRQVAATKCNDLSSRSHTVFTISAYVKKVNENGTEDLISAGKLNLVDLAGSENIQRSGAENKRAAEAGLINKSLLTLGRVINALVDRSAHIPYRESKLTRLLQDSLGGRTKTCIIATISPSKSNLEETISTLEYAFRAKNIRNKPQLNAMPKKTLLKEFTAEIEKLKSELISTRQRNGVHLPPEVYEEMTAESESRRIVAEEQGAKIETLETNLRNKTHELYSLNATFMGLKKDHEGTRSQLDSTKGLLEEAEMVIKMTHKSLAEETELRKAHEATEQKLTKIGGELIHKLQRTVKDVSGLHAKNKRKSDLQSVNRAAWGTSQMQVSDVTSMVERRVADFQDEQRQHISSISTRMATFVQEELQKLSATQTFLDEQLNAFTDSKRLMLEQKQKSKVEMDEVLEEINVIRDSVKHRVGESLQVISGAAEKIAADVVAEMGNLHAHLHNSYSSLGKDFKSIFEDLVKHLTAQRSESENLRRQLQSATNAAVLQNSNTSLRIQEVISEERRQAAEDRQKLLAQITTLINTQAETQETRFADKASQIQKSVTESGTILERAATQYNEGMELWDEKEGELLEEVKKSREQLKTKLKDDWNTASEQSTAIQSTAKSVHAETVRVVDEQVEDLGSKMHALDDFVTHARTANTTQHESQEQSIEALSNTVEQSFGNISSHFKSTFDRVKNVGEEMELDTDDMREALEQLDSQLCQPLANLREGISGTTLQEYQPTGNTPQKAVYQYPTVLPRTNNTAEGMVDEEDESSMPASPLAAAVVDRSTDQDQTIVFADLPLTQPQPPSTKASSFSSSSPRRGESSDTSAAAATSPGEEACVTDKNQALGASLREVNPNVTANVTAPATLGFEPSSRATSIATSMPPTAENATMPLLKRSTRTARVAGIKRSGVAVEGRENLPPSALASAGSKRKSPRLK
ncbi:kinesin heavy chain [Cordyceps fumosorosea ARSEF 2679]|uniref:Kinesin heavy chain n=1 Tax=Cordyceps fumosorosea (strain ARSEF 2679) TaxID=1081104 RepID=A0A168AJ86_CORFA|nr:kinesin heavy chain [Cordyceps fumosorosea ARSEF 2679]OAA68823.1 kinesin heavy chain [Cordyceps fumosorosea ARSEF 2679]